MSSWLTNAPRFGDGNALLHFADKPLVMVNQTLNRFAGQQLGVAATVGGKLGELRLGFEPEVTG